MFKKLFLSFLFAFLINLSQGLFDKSMLWDFLSLTLSEELSEEE